MKHELIILFLSGLMLGASGCASIVTGHDESVSVATQQEGVAVNGAACALSNDKGQWFVSTPGSVSLRRSGKALAVKCEKDGQPPGMVTVESSTKAMAFGNILFGGLIGAGVDMHSGAAYDYPQLITVEMGKSTVLKSNSAMREHIDY